MRVDAHQHFWRLDRGDYGWLTPALGAIHRDFLPDDLAPMLARQGIDRTILVQAAPTEAETRFLLDIAEAQTFVGGVVGWVDFEAPDAPDRIAALAASPWLKGLRPMIQYIADPDWMVRPALAPAFAAMQAHGLRFDALVTPRHLAPLGKFLARYPALRVVIDHGAKPDIARQAFHDWADALRGIARDSNAVCKLSGLATEAAADWADDDLAPYMDLLLEAFGADRLMWGGDWPVLNLNGDYDRWVGCVEQWAEPLSDVERAAIWGGTAARFYAL